jgi:hypothetical protein
MQKNIETLFDALRGIEEPQHFLRFVASRIDWDAEKVFEAYEAAIADRKAAAEAQLAKARDALTGISKDDAIALLAGVEGKADKGEIK